MRTVKLRKSADKRTQLVRCEISELRPKFARPNGWIERLVKSVFKKTCIYKVWVVFRRGCVGRCSEQLILRPNLIEEFWRTIHNTSAQFWSKKVSLQSLIGIWRLKRSESSADCTTQFFCTNFKFSNLVLGSKLLTLAKLCTSHERPIDDSIAGANTRPYFAWFTSSVKARFWWRQVIPGKLQHKDPPRRETNKIQELPKTSI